MSDTIIKVEGLSKRYSLGRQKSEPETALRDVIANKARQIVRRWHGRTDSSPSYGLGNFADEFWALKDINFEIKRGELVGVMGRNGAGKSTLLKILSRIVEPTRGRIVINGRIASLLEVGTGFHSELTGRENIYLNGAILGMSQREVRGKFDEIVAFAEIERFLDTPVKRYSSGMYVRLAFAVAAHLEPEILVVDEVLAVGDAEFQKKCLGKMENVARSEGRTVLFVSHNLGAVAGLTSRGILLGGGNLVADGPVDEVISAYLSQGASHQVYVADSSKHRPRPFIKRAEVLASEGNGVHQFGQSLEVRFWISHVEPLVKGCFSFRIVNQFQHNAIYAWAYFPDPIFGNKPGETILTCRIPRLRLNIGRYHLRTWLNEPPGMAAYEALDGICPFEVVRTRDSILWGWHPEACVYYEEFDWKVETAGYGPLPADGEGSGSEIITK